MRVIYCEMLGHDASFGFIHAVNYTQKAKLMDKRIGISPVSCLLFLFVYFFCNLYLYVQKNVKGVTITLNDMLSHSKVLFYYVDYLTD